MTMGQLRARLSSYWKPAVVTFLAIGLLYSADRWQSERRRAVSDELTASISTDDAALAKENAASAIDQNKARDCTSRWDGSIPSVVSRVTARLRDPNSFEHIETMAGAPGKDGNYHVVMRYRAKNGFGGFNPGIAEADVNGQTCEATLSGAIEL